LISQPIEVTQQQGFGSRANSGFFAAKLAYWPAYWLRECHDPEMSSFSDPSPPGARQKVLLHSAGRSRLIVIS
jgi:hypothetical protein